VEEAGQKLSPRQVVRRPDQNQTCGNRGPTSEAFFANGAPALAFLPCPLPSMSRASRGPAIDSRHFTPVADAAAAEPASKLPPDGAIFAEIDPPHTRTREEKNMANGGRLSGDVAIVTAGGQGIGEAIAKTFAREGATVAVVDINGKEAERVAGEIATAVSAGGGKAFALTVDVTKSDKVDAMVAEVVKRCGTVDILVNGAGGWHQIVPLVDITDEEWDRLLTLNITTAFY
jgi:hypothetical protein